MSEKGKLVISLDFELYWGVRDKKSLLSYKENLLGVRTAIPAILELFDKYEIHATWSTVGFLFFNSRDELIENCPEQKPEYLNSHLSPYKHIYNIGLNEEEDPYHFAPSLIQKIISYPYQRIGTHTFSHYYSLEQGQQFNSFKEDIIAAIKVGEKYGLKIESLVFPRNQCEENYLSACKELGITSYRGNERSWLYKATDEKGQHGLKRIARLADAYINTSGHNCYSIKEIKNSNLPLNIPSSRFLRPYSKTLKYLEPLRLKRIISDLDYAAKKKLVYHLWWHPHNFGINLNENLSFLESILKHFSFLRQNFDMESLNMEEFSKHLLRSETVEESHDHHVSR
ncbi:polysaccharide deacetylase family protein [Peribacillus frigoritolerans]|uniref:polysaccharide deacetylase family protein n=1 Tax=Peribacillus frigoritolerans TaxID=450367 RepID=UPI001059F218|nr:polysaccharide deacetylase family protein [Peribacillus frigoritolerans]TDL76470.1 polysaccharide deacetylase [Peribacillus frigoritolerans]